jgi:hypothetical protein
MAMPWLSRFRATICAHLSAHQKDRRHRRGAALLLVLIVVPALSIVGLSLLSMASFEAGRARAQQQIAQCLYSAEGGVARGTWVLLNSSQLGNVAQQLPAGVSACTATQGAATTGALNWNGANISLKATGVSGPYTRQVQRQFKPKGQSLNLKNVITTPGDIDMKKNCTINGPILTADPDPQLDGIGGTHPVTIAPVPALDVGVTIDNILAAYNEVTVTSAQIGASSVASPVVMNGGAGTAVYYTNDPGLWVSNSGGGNKCVSVEGECIWVIKGGADIGKEFTFSPVGTNPRLLILVAQGGWDVQKAIDAVGLALIVITNGDMDYKKAGTFSNVSMYSTSVDTDKDQNWNYVAATMDPWQDSLDSRNLLPRVGGTTTGTLTSLSGTWSELP